MSFSTPMAAESEFKKRYLPLSDQSGFVDADWKFDFEKADLHRLENFFSLIGKPLSKPGLGKRYRAELQLTHDGKMNSVFLKRYEGETLRNLLQRWLEDGEWSAIALREVRVATALEKIGITTFKPLAWGSQGKWGTNQKSFLVMSQVPGDSIERWLPQQNFIAANGSRKKIQLVEHLAFFAKRLHENGWFHRDFYLCHIFLAEVQGSFQLALVDLARMFRPRWRTSRWRIKDLAQLNFSAPTKYFSRTMRLRFAKTYFGVERLSLAHKIVLRKITERSEKIARRELRKNSGGKPAPN